MEDAGSEQTPGNFQLKNINLNNRCKDVFSCLDTLEQKHQAFEQSRAQEDAESDKRLIHQGPSFEDTETISPVSKPLSFSGRDYHESRKGGRHGPERSDQHQPFRKPMAPPPNARGRNSSRGRFGRGRAVPDYKLHPDRWTEYSLADVDTSDSSMKKAALDFLHERRQLREGNLKDESMDLDSSACSKGLFTFKKPSKDSASSEKMKDGVSKKTMKTVGSFEKMEDDDDNANSIEYGNEKEMIESNLDSDSKGNVDMNVSSSSLKRKSAEADLQDTMDTENDVEKKNVFKVRKIRQRNFRSQRDAEDDND